MYINERVRNMVRLKCEEDRNAFLRLDMNEDPEGLPESFVQEVLEKIDGAFLAAYPDKRRAAALLAKREGLSPENIALTNGSDEAIHSVLETFIRPGGRAVMVTPSFEMYRIYSEMLGVELEQVPYGEDLTLSVDVLKRKITPGTDLLILFNPNSPIGEAYTSEEIRELLDICRKTDTLVVIDEAYYPFGVSSAVRLLMEYSNLIVLRTFSKLYSLAGLRVGYALGEKELIRCLNNGLATYNVNAVGLLFAEELLKRPDIMEKLVYREAEGRKFLVERLEDASYQYYNGGGNYILIRSRKPVEETASRLYEAKILVKTYQNGVLKDWLRVTTGSRGAMERFWKEFCRCDN